MINLSELSMMKGMVDVLNESLKRPILTEEQYNMRLEDLKQFEEETGFVLLNSPTIKEDISSIIEVKHILQHRFERCNDVERVIEFANQKEMMVSLNLVGANVIIIYIDGIISKFIIDNAVINLNEVDNVPYKINKKDTYLVSGVLSYDLKFYVTDVNNDYTNLRDGFTEAKDLGFDVVPNWFATNFNPKNLESNIDYVFEYAKENELLSDGVTFRFNDISYSKDGIIYEMLK